MCSFAFVGPVFAFFPVYILLVPTFKNIRHYRHINKLKLHRSRSLLVTYGGSTILVFTQVTQAHSVWPSLGG